MLKHLDAVSTISGHSLHLADASPIGFESCGRIFEHLWPEAEGQGMLSEPRSGTNTV